MPKTTRKNLKNVERTLEERIALGLKIYAEYAKGIYSLESICKSFKVAIRTLYKWTEDYTELARAKKNANDLMQAPNPDELKVKARVSLEKLVTGFEYEEKTVDIDTTADGKLKSQKIRKVTKKVHPDTTAVIFTLKNTDAEHFNKGATDTNISIGDISIESISQQITPEAINIAIDARKARFDKLRASHTKEGNK